MSMRFDHSHANMDAATVVDTGKHLLSYLEHCQRVVDEGGYSAPEALLNVLADASMLEVVDHAVAHTTSPALRYVIVVGIGGSNLGTKALYDALYGSFDSFEPQRFPKMIFLDTCDSALLEKFDAFFQERITNAQEFLINLISKSGSTTESIVNAELLLAMLTQRFPRIPDRMVITTDEGSPLWNAARSMNIVALPIPRLVGGRFSVFTAVGCFPLQCIGVDVRALHAGALAMRDQCLSQDIANNPAVVSATILYLYHGLGRTIHDSFFFDPRLESLGRWYRQLLGESIGKEKDIDEETVHVGITPTVSIGSTDLHSVGQLYLGGPADKVTTFVRARSSAGAMVVPDRPIFSGLIDSIAGKTPQDIMAAIYQGITIAYTKRERPFMEVELDDISAKSIGEFFQWKMMEVMYLGHLLNINAFDQPNVEEYKVETRKILSAAS